MIIKIGGVEINKASEVNGLEQLQEGLGEIGINTTTQAITWISELSLVERLHLSQIVGEWTFNTALSMFTFGIF